MEEGGAGRRWFEDGGAGRREFEPGAAGTPGVEDAPPKGNCPLVGPLGMLLTSVAPTGEDTSFLAPNLRNAEELPAPARPSHEDDARGGRARR